MWTVGTICLYSILRWLFLQWTTKDIQNDISLLANKFQRFLNSETLNKDLLAKYFKTYDIYFPPFLLPHADRWHKIFFQHFSSASTPISYSSIHSTTIPNYEIIFITDTDLLGTWKGRWQWNIDSNLLYDECSAYPLTTITCRSVPYITFWTPVRH
jgi:hypothetical protein